MKKLRWPAILMIVAILGITGFQAWWMKTNYDREKQNLDIQTAAAFRQTVLQLQAGKLKFETFTLRNDSTFVTDVVVNRKKPTTGKNTPPAKTKEQAISLLNLVQERVRDSIQRFQKERPAIIVSIKSDSFRHLAMDSTRRGRTIVRTFDGPIDSLIPDPGMIREMRILRDSIGKKRVVAVAPPDGETIEERIFQPALPRPLHPDLLNDTAFEKANPVIRFLYDIDSLTLKDSITTKEITEAFTKRLDDDKIDVGFKVIRYDTTSAIPADAVTIGFSRHASFGFEVQDTLGYMFGKLKLPLLFSLLLVGITIASFVLLYRNMMKQKRLAELKNEFISNITHELKTPIATVGVAIEALKNFNAIDDPRRTKEYLDISQNELQRLNLLVDKVLKLSMFEKKEIELKYETLNLEELVEEVLNSMRLQIEKYKATVSVNSEGDCFLQGDRLHLLSVIFNLIDNALKYSSNQPVIQVHMEEREKDIMLTLTDNGIGIPPEYSEKVFEKFFRIPHGNTHNAKGYGLGLSYTAHVIRKHKGTIQVKSQPGQGAAFIITLPKQPI